ncbi:peptidase inhibitor family I36 protein [Streptomyces sp. NPDC051567]|uniref:peptidase inhibitor family I36 protein n=1 Tax=Streptomyces sp. NPDC051567 TaxID=3365660 RepID=UPI00378FF75E
MTSRTGRRLGTIALGLATVAGTALVAGASAAAGDACETGQFCMYENSDGTGQDQRVGNQYEGNCLRATMILADHSLHQARKIFNNTPWRAAAFKSNDCSGTPAGILPSTATVTTDGGPLSFRLFDCEDGKVCFWEGVGFSGTKSTKDWAHSCAPTGVEARSVWNRSSKGIGIYVGWACVGAGWKGDVAPGAYTFPNEGVSKFSRV